MKTLYLYIFLFLGCSAAHSQSFIIDIDRFIVGVDAIPQNSGLFQPLMFYYNQGDKAAFRAGWVTNNAWDLDSLGQGSIAGGLSTVANQPGSASFGQMVSAPSENSLSTGNQIKRNGTNSWASGRNVVNHLPNSIVHGRGITSSISLVGNGESYLFGRDHTQTGIGSLVCGYNNEVGNLSFLSGKDNRVLSGRNFSTGIGEGLIVHDNRQLVVGKFNTNTGTLGAFGNHLLVVGNGTSDSNRSNAMVVTNSKSVGIGTNTPCGTVGLEVMGNISFDQEIINNSDRRLKKRFKKLKSVGQKLKEIDAYRYEFRRDEFAYKEFPEGEQIGVLAHELAEEFPELITTDNEGFMHVDYTRLAVVLLEAIKEADHKNEKLKERLSNLENVYASIKR